MFALILARRFLSLTQVSSVALGLDVNWRLLTPKKSEEFSPEGTLQEAAAQRRDTTDSSILLTY